MNSSRFYTGVVPTTVEEAKAFNRAFLHEQGFRACHGCLSVLPKTTEHFHIKCGIQLNSRCKPCQSERARETKLRQKHDPEWYCKRLCTAVKSRAKEQSVSFDLDGEWLYELLQEQANLCYYTGQALDFTVENAVTTTPHRLMPSLDRLNPSKGYVKGNVVWCLFYVNRMKNDLTYDEFVELCEVVLKTQNQ